MITSMETVDNVKDFLQNIYKRTIEEELKCAICLRNVDEIEKEKETMEHELCFSKKCNLHLCTNCR
jgi:hypothetical protein